MEVTINKYLLNDDLRNVPAPFGLQVLALSELPCIVSVLIAPDNLRSVWRKEKRKKWIWLRIILALWNPAIFLWPAALSILCLADAEW